MGLLNGKTALITGATSGIGLAAAHRLAVEGAHVVITGRRRSALDAAIASITGGATGDVVGVAGDVSSDGDLEEIMAVIAERGGGLDVLFANAGGGEFGALSDITREHYHQTFERNVAGTLFTVQKALRVLNDGANDHPFRVDVGHQEQRRVRRLRSVQGGDPLVRAHLGG